MMRLLKRQLHGALVKCRCCLGYVLLRSVMYFLRCVCLNIKAEQWRCSVLLWCVGQSSMLGSWNAFSAHG